MAFDGFTVAAVTDELNKKLKGGRILKIAQPECDELMLTVSCRDGRHKLLLSANASVPMICLTNKDKKSPMTAPSFCMLLRKHLSNAEVLSVRQPGFERSVRIETEHLNEMGDLTKKTLLIEIMGKYSNIILTETDDEGNETVVDAIKRVSSLVSSVREVLPGRPYFIPDAMGKSDPLTATEESFNAAVDKFPGDPEKAICSSFSGISMQAASEIVRLSDGDLWGSFIRMTERVKSGNFSPVIYLKNGIPSEFSSVDTGYLPDKEAYESVSEMLSAFYDKRESASRIKAKSASLRQQVQTLKERAARKAALQEKSLKDTEKREKYRLYGELLTAYAYQIPAGVDHYEAENYNDGTVVKIPMDASQTASENAKRYYDRYVKLKRTYEAAGEQLSNSLIELEHLESLELALSFAENEDDLTQISEELELSGYSKKKNDKKKKKEQSKPFHFETEDGYQIYVGRNNIQNEELTFKFADGGDMWFHAKKMAGSHVIVKTGGRELPDSVYETAAAAAAYFSTAKDQTKAEVDYTWRKNIKKPPGTPPGYVIYHTNYSMAVAPDISKLKKI